MVKVNLPLEDAVQIEEKQVKCPRKRLWIKTRGVLGHLETPETTGQRNLSYLPPTAKEDAYPFVISRHPLNPEIWSYEIEWKGGKFYLLMDFPFMQNFKNGEDYEELDPA